jgi:phosphopantetheinyl transferase
MKTKLLCIAPALWLLSITAGAQDFNEVFKAVAPDRAAKDHFGNSVSISGNYAIVSANWEDEDAGGMNTFDEAGSAYIFERDGSGNWTEVQKIVASDREALDNFGYSVSISGNYVLVGAPSDPEGGNPLEHAGSAYIFERDGSGNWNEVQKIVASDRDVDDYFGFSVSISGNYAIVGAYWEEEDAEGGNTLVYAGSAYIFERDGSGNWNEVQKIVASDRALCDFFGYSVSISGNYAIVGVESEDEDAAGVNTLVYAGSAYIFERDGSGNWNEVQKIVASDRAEGDRFGISVSISGNYAIVGAYYEDEDAAGVNTLVYAGSAYIFERDGSGNWNEVQKIVAHDRAVYDWFGTSVSISGNYVIVGAYGEDKDAEGGNTLNYAGSAYIFERDGSGTWNEVQKIVAPDRGIGDHFGYSVSISGNYVLVGAYGEDKDAEGGNTLTDAGSAYFFESGTPTSIQDIYPGNSTGVKIFPNPVSGYLNVYAEEGSSIKLYNDMGLLVIEENMLNGRLHFETAGLPKGVYMVKVNMGNKVTVNKVVIQ